MTRITVAGSLLAADSGARTLTYRLLPYGEQGRTSAGLVTASRGTITLPAPADVVLNVEHDRTRPVGRATALVEDAGGLTATFSIAATTAGDDLLAEAAAGLRPGASVELDEITIRRGALLAGRLVAAGAVVTPAFPSALLVAADTEPEPAPADPDAPDPDEDDDELDDDAAGAADTEPNGDDPMPDTDTTTAAAPAAAPAALVAAATPARTTPDLATASRLLAAAGRGDRSAELSAALSDLTYTALAEVVPPAYIGEAWSGVAYERQVIPLLSSAPLTSYKVSGWRWTTAPAGGAYAGDKAAIPSNAAATEPVEFTAERWAGGHDHDRALLDFGDPGYWASYWARMAVSYAKWSDDAATTDLLAAAPAITPAGTGVVAAIVAGVLAVIPSGSPTFVILGSAAYAELVERDPLAFLSGGINLGDATGNVGGLAIRASAAVPADDVVVGNRNAATWYELGSTPLRVEAVNIANGGVDTGAFGYGVLGVHNAAALAQVTVSPVVTP